MAEINIAETTLIRPAVDSAIAAERLLRAAVACFGNEEEPQPEYCTTGDVLEVLSACDSTAEPHRGQAL